MNEIEKILYFVKYVLINDATEEQKKEIFKRLEADYKVKLDEIEALYKDEAAIAAQGIKKNDVERLYSENKSNLEKEFNRIKSVVANLRMGATILESDYRNIFRRFDDVLNFKSGSDSIYKLLSGINVEKEIKELIKDFGGFKGEAKNKALKLMKLLINLYISGVKPEWMVIKNLPVIPPDLRPVVQLDGGRFASSDVNLFYRRVLMRNIRLKKMIQVGMPDVVKKNEIRLLQESINNLIIGEKAGAAK